MAVGEDNAPDPACRTGLDRGGVHGHGGAMLVLVTGATGFLGSAVARALLARGHEVRALVRPGTPRTVLEGLEIQYALGDLTDQPSLAYAAAK